jgi:ribulose 1,5-bisphosphate synthetase/thiazole synthase
MTDPIEHQSEHPTADAAQGTATEDIEQHDYDVVVIGAGGAGLRAAIEARLNGKRVAIISKRCPVPVSSGVAPPGFGPGPRRE